MARAGKCFECVLQGEVEDIAYKEYVYNFDDKCPQYIHGVPHYEVRARHVFSGSTTFQGEAVEMPSDGGQKWELRYIGRWERKKMSEHVGSAPLGVPFRSQIAVSVGQNVRSFLNTLGFRYRYMRLGTRWQFPNGITIEATRMKALKNEDEKDEYRLVDLENLRVEALLVEIFALTTDEKIDEASQKIRRFAVDLDPYFIERPSEGKEILHSTATLAAEVRRKRPRP
ncbi:Rap guanine nucleotide exchange factor 3 [Phytophthora nicotianae]|uniref:Mediator of RNA polymerase II transcription subunit 18 n=1 Tax=Phytophthora nicotianae TaxID=4792 RepID=A0A0W8CZ10_PHYNI|nr:Rap guanine nucleotide exchange factor 3 [Phytophthora nicotianae]